MSQEIGDDSIELRHYVWVLRRRWWVVVLGGLIGSLLAVGYLAVKPGEATATAIVQLNVISSTPFGSGKPDSQLIDANTEAQLAKSSKVLSSAAQTLGQNQTLASIRHRTVVTPLTDATIVKINFTAPSSAKAAAGAHAIAQSYLDYRSSLADGKVQAVVGSLQKRADDLNAQLTAANRKFLEAQSGSQQALQADSQRQLISTQLDAVLGQIDSLNTIDTSGGNLISDAGDNPIAVSPSKKIVLLTGGLLGLILGAIAAFVVNRRDDRIFEWRATRPFGGGELLAEIPSSDARLPSTGVDLDAFRTLRERLLSTSGPIVVAIDLTTGDQPSDMGSNLAVAFAESVPHVQLILPDYPTEFVRRLAADLRLERETDPDPAVEHPAITAYRSRAMKGLRVVALGSESPGDPSVSRIARMLHDAEGTDVVSIIALPPHGSRSLRLAAARLGHSVLLVATLRGTRVRTVKALAEELAAVGAVVHGGVLVPKGRHLDLDADLETVSSAWEKSAALDKSNAVVGDPDGSVEEPDDELVEGPADEQVDEAGDEPADEAGDEPADEAGDDSPADDRDDDDLADDEAGDEASDESSDESADEAGDAVPVGAAVRSAEGPSRPDPRERFKTKRGRSASMIGVPRKSR